MDVLTAHQSLTARSSAPERGCEWRRCLPVLTDGNLVLRSTTGTMPPRLAAFVVAVIVVGAAALADSVTAIRQSPFNIYLILLAALTVASGRFAIKVPGRPATVSVSEVFVFTLVLLFGPAAATLTVAIDGVLMSLTHKDRRLYRALFNIAEPAISTWTAAHVFFAIARTGPLSQPFTSTPVLVLATAGMATVFFVLNSALTSVAIALEIRTSPYEVWRRHAWFLGVNYYAAASFATLAVGHGSTLNVAVVGLVAPLLILSYVAYREASTRVDEVHRHVGEVEHLYRAAVEMLTIAVDAKDQVTHGHICRVQRHTVAMAKALGVTDALELKAIEAGALLHDIGKLAVPDYILNKPSALSRAEYETMKKHANMGARILTAVDFPYPIVPIVRHHHEQWDGGGYPDGLVGAEITLGARILAVVDCFDALTSDRPYRPKLSDERAMDILRARKGSFYDPMVVERFIELIPALRVDDAASRDGSEVRGSVVAGLARSAGERGRECDAEAARSTPAPLRRRVRALIDEQVARIGAADACLFAISSAGDALLVAHATSRLHDAVTSLQLPVGSGVSGWVAANRSTIRNADPALDLGELAEPLGLRCCTSTPVFTRGDLFGVLTVYGTHPAGVSEHVAAVVGMLAQEVGLMIARADAERDDDTNVVVARRLPMAAAS
jgi:putative nucleotidyltransferase with HDIG domain